MECEGFGVTKECPLCGGELVVRRDRRKGREVLGCSRNPRCEYTEPVPESVRMRMMGAPVLPGLE